MADDAFRPSWTTPSIEFAILPPAVGRRAPKQLKAFGVGENYCARGGFSDASQRSFSERSRITDKFKRRRAHNGRNASAPAHISREQKQEMRKNGCRDESNLAPAAEFMYIIYL